MNDKMRLGLAFLFLLVAGSVYWYGHSDRNKLAPGFRKSFGAATLMDQLLSHWRELPLANGEVSANLWECPVIVTFVFNVSDCALCLARVDELVTFVDSLADQINVGLLCVGISYKTALLDHYLAVSPKSCPVLRDTCTASDIWDGGATPQIIIIDRRDGITLARGLVSARKVTGQFLNKLRGMIVKGW